MVNKKIETIKKLLYDEINPKDCNLKEGIIFPNNYNSETYEFNSLDKFIKDFEGDNKYKLELAVSYFIGKIISDFPINEESKEFYEFKIFVGALAVAYRVNPEELFKYLLNYELCQYYW